MATQISQEQNRSSHHTWNGHPHIKPSLQLRKDKTLGQRPFIYL